MREFDSLLDRNMYRVIMAIVIVLMIAGVIIGNEWGIQLLVHSLFVSAVSLLIVLFLRQGTNRIKCALIFTATIYFYVLFFLYPKTASTLVLLTCAPILAILFFHRRMFYTLFSVNALFLAGLFMYLYMKDSNNLHDYLRLDMAGNILNIITIQVIIFFVFYLTSKRIERLSVYYQEIQKAERLRTAGQLAAAVAHEIRNPITVVSGFLQMYQQDQEIPVHVRQNFQLMQGELGMAEHVIQDFLSLAKPRSEQADCIHVQDTLHSVIDLLSSYALMNSVSIVLDAEGDDRIACSAVEFKQVMVNLLKNAIEAIGHDGTIFVSVEQRAGAVGISIQDTGAGMTEEELLQIGTPFYSLKSKGTGLGLMICYNIMEKCGGSLKFASKKREGTMVELTFPVCCNHSA
ncbi:sensor histidine kinase [Ectobacillus ponti]|uniref:histidine kinase n=1 Tax=Ectobacillus ponti TaxID=2961894 RepID=A0AA41X6T3_9BACI|nr:HAMP domain-containing sensor histidine kinase [Ectobacillus ponti]MCP8969872.1 HAMP domain-containing histidine kinase [Ectobacillus ponti]